MGSKISLAKEQNLALAKILGASFSKVSVAGGEPLLCPNIIEIIAVLRDQGATTAIITNGSRLIEIPSLINTLAPHLDWIGLSVDSFTPTIQKILGRAVKGEACNPESYVELASRIQSAGIRLKINTVVTKLTYRENMIPWITRMAPERWKIFQVLPIEGQNDDKVGPLLITEKEFRSFEERHRQKLGELVVAESNSAMIGSYAMIDPAGRFFDNVSGKFQYSQSIVDVGIKAAFSQIEFFHDKFEERGGIYDWMK